MTDKERQSQRRRAEDAAFNRMLLCLLGAVAAELVILLVKHFYVDISGAAWSIRVAAALLQIFKVYQFIGIVLTVLGIVWTVLARRGGKPIRLPLILTVVVFFLWVVATVAYHFSDTGLRILLILPATAAVLILIYFLYQRIFFINAVLIGGGMAALWLYRQYYENHPGAILACFIAGWVVLVIAAVLCVQLRASGGRLGQLRVMPERANYLTTWITCGVVAVLMLLGLLLGTTVAFYLFFGLVAWLFCQAVFFTVKLM